MLLLLLPGLHLQKECCLMGQKIWCRWGQALLARRMWVGEWWVDWPCLSRLWQTSSVLGFKRGGLSYWSFKEFSNVYWGLQIWPEWHTWDGLFESVVLHFKSIFYYLLFYVRNNSNCVLGSERCQNATYNSILCLNASCVDTAWVISLWCLHSRFWWVELFTESLCECTALPRYYHRCCLTFVLPFTKYQNTSFFFLSINAFQRKTAAMSGVLAGYSQSMESISQAQFAQWNARQHCHGKGY